MAEVVSTQQEISELEANARTLRAEMNWLKQVLDTRINTYFGQASEYKNIYEVPVPNLAQFPSPYSTMVKQWKMSVNDRLVVLLGLAPTVCPQLLDCLFIRNEMNGQVFTEFGGIKGNVHRGFLPTGETAAFLLAANDLTRRFQVMQMFDEDYYLIKQKIIVLDDERNKEPSMSAALKIGLEAMTTFTTGGAFKPKFSSEFPAQRLHTRLDWDDLVLEFESEEKIREVLNWVSFQKVILEDWGLEKILKRGYRSLFYGPPGTGKTLTASLSVQML